MKTSAGRVARTTAFKLSAIYLAVFTAFALIFVLSIGFAANRLLNQQLAEAVEEEILSLAEPWNEGGVVGLLGAIENRGSRPGAELYLLVDNLGRRAAGNVTRVAGDLLARAVQEPITTTYVDPEGAERLAVVRAVRLSGGYTLLVGRDIAENRRFGGIIRGSLVLAGALLIGLGAVSWFFVNRRVLRRIDSVSAATQRIMAGDLTGRLEVTGTGDEFDRLAASVNAMLERIEHLLDGLKTVSDNIAHDLKTPLTRMRNRIEAALAAPPDRDGERAVLHAAIEDADQLIRTFNALLMIARIEAGAPDGAMGEVDLAAIVRDAAELYEPVAEEAGAVMTVSAEEPLQVRGNRELLGQAVANLLDNAVKHTARVSADAPPAHVAVRARKEGGAALVEVADNGPGIPEADRSRVLERFVRLEASRSKPGTGLGLSLVAAVVKLHDGTMTLGDNGPGLSVALRLPLGGTRP